MPSIPVIAGIIRNNKGQVLLCQRDHGSLEGLWEFPGGKIERGETPEQCLEREIREELDLNVEVERVYKVVHASYDHGDFLLISFLAALVGGEIKLRVHRDVHWVDPQKLMNYPLADANIPIAQSLKEEADAAWASMGGNGRTHQP